MAANFVKLEVLELLQTYTIAAGIKSYLSHFRPSFTRHKLLQIGKKHLGLYIRSLFHEV